MSISSIQEKLLVFLDKNKPRVANEGELYQYTLKPIPNVGIQTKQHANERLGMQIACQLFGIDAIENALVFFKNVDTAYIAKRFDVKNDVAKQAIEDLLY